jgi:DNA-binding MarR family transcriptional regulator
MEPVEEPHWLDGEERAAWLTLASVVVRLPAMLDAQLQRDAGISHFEYQVLAGLSEAPSRALRMSQLAACSDASLSRLSQVVTRLEKRGWIRRTPDPSDGRSTLAVLTSEGWEKVASSAPGHAEAVRSLVVEPLTKAQLRQLTHISQRILQTIDLVAATTTPPDHGRITAEVAPGAHLRGEPG